MRAAPRWYALALPAYTAAMLALDTQADARLQLGIGALTWIVLVAACAPLVPEQRARVAIVIAAATIAEVTGSLLWGVYTYRLDNLPSFVPPGHGLVYLSGLALAECLRRHSGVLVAGAALGVTGWAVAGLTVLPRLDVAGAFGVPLLLACFWRSRGRAVYAGVFLVVAALELYGTALGTWTWAAELPGLGIPDGNPPSGAASGYVCFDVAALALSGVLLRRVRSLGAAVGWPRAARWAN